MTDYNFAENRGKYMTAYSYAYIHESGKISGGDVNRKEREEDE